MGRKKKQKKYNIPICVEVVNIMTREVKNINLGEKRVIFDNETNTYQEVKITPTSNYDDGQRPNKK